MARLVRTLALTLIAGSCSAQVAIAQDTAAPVTIQQSTLSLAGAQQVAAAITQLAHEQNDHVAVAIVDVGGNLIYFERMDGAVLGASDIAMAKARTAVELTAPTQVFADLARQNSGAALGLLSAGYSLMPGGRPITIDGHVVGAVAVSGAANGADDSYALAGLAAIGAI